MKMDESGAVALSFALEIVSLSMSVLQLFYNYLVHTIDSGWLKEVEKFNSSTGFYKSQYLTGIYITNRPIQMISYLESLIIWNSFCTLCIVGAHVILIKRTLREIPGFQLLNIIPGFFAVTNFLQCGVYMFLSIIDLTYQSSFKYLQEKYNNPIRILAICVEKGATNRVLMNEELDPSNNIMSNLAKICPPSRERTVAIVWGLMTGLFLSLTFIFACNRKMIPFKWFYDHEPENEDEEEEEIEDDDDFDLEIPIRQRHRRQRPIQINQVVRNNYPLRRWPSNTNRRVRDLPPPY